ncbi:Uncharacterised protein [Achromobacter sp. 2789STDY5608633]|uniref:hypothetical protein n=1 Tax=Achromobacter sp. 2789STDY5608633 TaxID=1806501 RepID=UPI0006C6EB64|nr:hypothetical protein [Achromobacter sp. 2789STDY5608633]CUJ49896.1 Uncharacterised protein [Achromobacter sp. 2789STDY5608633]
MRTLVILVFWWFAISQALQLGGIWQLRAHPMRDVTVYVDPNQTIKGQLSREWDGTWILSAEDGMHHFLMGESPPAMSYKLDTNRHSSFLDHWRALLPMLLVTVIAMMLLAPWREIRRLHRLLMR